MKNQYFNIYKITKDNKGYITSDEFISTVRIRYEEDICKKIYNDIAGVENIEYCIDFKPYIKKLFPDVYNTIYDINKRFNKVDINEDQYVIYEGTVDDYRKIDKEFDNEMKFLESITTEIAKDDKHKDITEELLIKAGFEYLEHESNIGKEFEKETYGIEDYKIFRKWTEDEHPIKLDIDNGWNNRFGTDGWYLHIDNDACETIGSADISNVWEFNTLMQVFGSKFRL